MSRLPAPPKDGFCARAWQHTAALQEAICAHPFNAALADGTLDRDRFAFYIVQDSRYLVGFCRALAAAATRADDPEDAAFFAGSARTAIVAERTLHAGYVEQFGLRPEDIDGIHTSPTCLAYTSYLHAVALTEPYPVLVAAVLPCFWVYHHVGHTILERTGVGADHPYREWIATYADDEFAASVGTARDITDRVARSATAETENRMLAAFGKASEYEWMFWDSAWRLETWPTRHWIAPN